MPRPHRSKDRQMAKRLQSTVLILKQIRTSVVEKISACQIAQMVECGMNRTLFLLAVACCSNACGQTNCPPAPRLLYSLPPAHLRPLSAEPEKSPLPREAESGNGLVLPTASGKPGESFAGVTPASDNRPTP